MVDFAKVIFTLMASGIAFTLSIIFYALSGNFSAKAIEIFV
jgi:hypothetical protein